MLSDRKHYAERVPSSRSVLVLPPLQLPQSNGLATPVTNGSSGGSGYSTTRYSAPNRNSMQMKQLRFRTDNDLHDSMAFEYNNNNNTTTATTERDHPASFIREAAISNLTTTRNPIRAEYMQGAIGQGDVSTRKNQPYQLLGGHRDSSSGGYQQQSTAILNQQFKSNGARYSLNSIPSSPARIFVRNSSQKRLESSSLDPMIKSTASYTQRSSASLSSQTALPIPSVAATATPQTEFSSPVQRKALPAATKKPLKMAQRYGLTKQQLLDLEEKEKDQQYFDELNLTAQSDEIVPEDKKSKDLVGTLAVNAFYQHYKDLQKVNQQNTYFDIVPSMQTDLLMEIERINIAPSKLGLIKPDGDEDTLKLNHMHFGDKYASVLSQGLQKVKSIKRFHLQGNRISDKSSAQLITCLSKSAKELNLASNMIGNIGCLQLSVLLSDAKSTIEILNLEDNKLGDDAISQLFRGIYRNKSLRVLNISKNNLTDRISEDLKRIVDSHELNELYLHWNLISATGGATIFEGLKTNEQLKVLDMSYNTLGKSTSRLSCAQAIADYIAENTELKHVDLSSNQFGRQDSMLIAAALSKNKSIYGFHFTGNVGYVDSRGFLVIGTPEEEELFAFQSKLRIDGMRTVDTQIIRQNREKDLRDCCWICEGWKETQFTWKSGVSGFIGSDPMFIHFNFEDFRGNYFGNDNGVEEGLSKVFTYNRIIPPGELEFFFSTENAFEAAADLKKKFNYEGANLPNVLQYEDNLVTVELKELNFLNIHPNKQTFSKYEPLFSILPRTRDAVYVPPRQKKKRVKWTFPISLFVKWRPDDEELLKKCFQFDWEYGKIPKLLKREEEMEEVKKFFCANYRTVKDCYKNYATKYPVGDIWAVQNPAFLELIEKMKIVDRSLIKDPDMNLKWVSTISSIPSADKTNPRNPVQAISRYQFMEVLVRIAEEKYVLKYKTTTNYFEAVKMLWDEHLSTEMSQVYNQQIWRNERYWVEECDLCLKHYKKIVEHVYKKFSKMKVRPGQQPFMSLDELILVCAKAGLNEEAHFGPNVALQAYNFSMMTQIDELQSDRIYQMQIVEFYEALARIAEAASLLPIKGIYNDSEDEEVWNLERRKGMILGHKLEALLVRLLMTTCDASFREKYPPIRQSFFVVDDDSDYELVSPS